MNWKIKYIDGINGKVQTFNGTLKEWVNNSDKKAPFKAVGKRWGK